MSQQPPLLVLQDWLDSYLNFERTPRKGIFWLDTMEFLCRRLGNPQEAYKTVHVAGSKGKGSVAVMTASILEQAGHKTGLYTSPHVADFSERIGTAGGRLDDGTYERSVLEIMRAVDPIIPEQLPGGRPVTWFELVTAFAFLCFRNAGCGWAVLEAGLGGRLDATNVVTPQVSVITPIELEHTEFLGGTPEKIAAEKAGIIKPGIPVVAAAQDAGVTEVLSRRASECGSRFLSAERLLTRCEGRMLGQRTEAELDSPLFSRPVRAILGMTGGFQAHNAGLAALAAKAMFPDMDESAIERGLAAAKLPGRFEITGNPGHPVVLDGAHTPKSMAGTLETFFSMAKGAGPEPRPHLLFACAADKNVEELAALFSGFGRITLTRPGSLKDCDPERMAAAFRSAGLEHTFVPDHEEAIRTAMELAEESRAALLVSGSFYLVAEAKKAMNEPRHRASGYAPAARTT